MNDYYFYRYKFKEVPAEPSLVAEEETGTPRDVLGSKLAKAELRIMHTKSKGDVEKYHNRIYYHDGVGLMQLQNNMQLPITDENFKTEKQDSHPFLNVVIDNREGRQIIGIEKNSSFKKRRGDNNSTQRVADLIAESVSNYLREHGRIMEIEPVAREGELWKTVMERIIKKNKRVRSIEYLFPADDEDDENKPQKDTALYILMNLLRKSGSSDGSFKANYAVGDEKEMKMAEADFRATEMFASKEHYQINVQFNDMSIVRAKDKLYAHTELLERDLADFISGAPGLKGTFMLNDELDKIYESLKGYEDK